MRTSLPENPFAPPQAELQHLEGVSSQLAERGTRLAAAIVDTLLYLVPVLVFAMVIGNNESLAATPAPVLALGAVLLGVAAPQCYFVTVRGQSLGKMLTRIRIVRTNGSACGFVHGVLLRSWVVTMIGQVPLAGFVFSLVDVLMIFRQDRRCLHDMLADTCVVSVAVPTQAQPRS